MVNPFHIFSNLLVTIMYKLVIVIKVKVRKLTTIHTGIVKQTHIRIIV